jgi:membrane dipeptidase
MAFSPTEIQEIHRSALPVDLHADTPILLRLGYNFGIRHDPPLPRSAACFHLDLPRLREGGLAAQFFGLPSKLLSLPFGRRGSGAIVDGLLDALEKTVQEHPRSLLLVRKATEIQAAHAQGLFAGLRGIEGAHALEGNLDRVAHFSRRGVAYLSLLHLCANEAGAPAYGWGRNAEQGLTRFGHDLIEELNRCRMIVDLAHINRRGFLEAAQASIAPVIVSHTGVCGAHPHWRNIDDEQILAVAKTRGCIGVIFSRRYLGAEDLHGVCNHLEHLIRVGGEDLPALGSDYDGMVTPPAGLEDVSCLPNLTAALLHRGLSERQVRKILGENALRVLQDVAG